MKRAKLFAVSVMPVVLAAVVAAAPAAAQDQEPQAQRSQDQAPQDQTSQGQAPAAQTTEAINNGSLHLDRFLDETRTFRAQFSQELLDGDGNLVEAASGTFSLKRPNRFLWSYAEPFEQQVVADAANVWIHDVELAQITVSPLDGAIASSPAMLLSGDGQARDGFELTESFRDGPIDWIRLTPRERGVDFHLVQVGFDAGELAALILVDALGQVTSIEFHDVMVNLDIEDEFFEFNPPAGTDVIGEPVRADNRIGAEVEADEQVDDG